MIKSNKSQVLFVRHLKEVIYRKFEIDSPNHNKTVRDLKQNGSRMTDKPRKRPCSPLGLPVED